MSVQVPVHAGPASSMIILTEVAGPSHIYQPCGSDILESDVLSADPYLHAHHLGALVWHSFYSVDMCTHDVQHLYVAGFIFTYGGYFLFYEPLPRSGSLEPPCL